MTWLITWFILNLSFLVAHSKDLDQFSIRFVVQFNLETFSYPTIFSINGIQLSLHIVLLFVLSGVRIRSNLDHLKAGSLKRRMESLYIRTEMRSQEPTGRAVIACSCVTATAVVDGHCSEHAPVSIGPLIKPQEHFMSNYTCRQRHWKEHSVWLAVPLGSCILTHANTITVIVSHRCSDALLETQRNRYIKTKTLYHQMKTIKSI